MVNIFSSTHTLWCRELNSSCKSQSFRLHSIPLPFAFQFINFTFWKVSAASYSLTFSIHLMFAKGSEVSYIVLMC